jgi:methionyl aminopeptidase
MMTRSRQMTPADTDAAYAAAQCVVEIHRRLAREMRTGHTLGQIDGLVLRWLDELKCESCFFKYRQGRLPPFPSQACLSVNECVVHGTAGYYEAPMKPGDILKVDIGVLHRGWIGDAAWTYAFKDYPSAEARRLMDSGKESLRRGVKELRPGNTYLSWARAVQQTVETEHKFHLIRGLGGHGYYRRKLHESPFISNVVPADLSPRGTSAEWPDASTPCLPGAVVAVEPMVAIGTSRTYSQPHQWPVFSADRSLAVHYEHDVMITENGPRLLTEGLDDLPDIVG